MSGSASTSRSSRNMAEFLGNALKGDWGVSMVSGRPVMAEVLNVLPWTIELTLVSLVIGIVIGVPLGVLAAVRRNRFFDYVARIASLARPVLPGLRLGDHPALPLRHRGALVPGDLGALGKPRGLDPVDHLAGHQSRPHQRGLHHARHALGHARGAVRGLCAHGARQGRAGERSSSGGTPCATP